MSSLRLNAIIGDNIVAGGNNQNEKDVNIYGVVPKRPTSPMMTKLYNTKYNARLSRTFEIIQMSQASR